MYQRLLAFIVLSLPLHLLTVLADEPLTQSFPPERLAIECTPRSGWPNFIAEAIKGNSLKVAYLGGSITAQNGWRTKSLAWLNATYPQSKFSEINASLGGTGSSLGVARLEHDVLKANPDLVFIEFAVNDAAVEPHEIVRSMEGIVRKTWEACPTCDLCFVYTISDKLLPELKTGKLNRSAAAMELVADYYGIPSICLGLEVVRLEEAGKLLMKEPLKQVQKVEGSSLNQTAGFAGHHDDRLIFSIDGVHPYLDTGHRFYLEAIQRSIPVIQGASVATQTHVLPAPLDAGNYQAIRAVNIEALKMTGSWTKLPSDDELAKHFRLRVDSLWKAKPGAMISFSFRGANASVYDVIGPGSGSIEVTVDGKVARRLLFDGYCTDWRLHQVAIARGLDTNHVHEVTLRVLDEVLPKDKILVGKNRTDLEQNPGKYAGLDWYVGAVFLDGDAQ